MVKTERVIMRQSTEALERILVCVLAQFALGKWSIFRAGLVSDSCLLVLCRTKIWIFGEMTFLTCAMLISTVDTCYASVHLAFERISRYRCLRLWPMQLS